MTSSLFGEITFLRNANSITLQPNSNLSATYSLLLPPTAPVDDDVLVWDSPTGSLQWVNKSTFGGSGGGTLTNVTVPSPFAVSVSAGTADISFAPNQAVRLFLATPIGTPGAVSLRSIGSADIPSLDASKITSGTFGVQRMPSGTGATQWQINGQVILKPDSSTTLGLYQSDGIMKANLSVDTLTAVNATVQNLTSVSQTTIDTQDTWLRLNTDFTTGTPIVDLGIEGFRGSDPKAILKWDETADVWVAGTETNLNRIVTTKEKSFTNADLISGILTFAHNLNVTGRRIACDIWDNAGRSFNATITFVDANTVSVNLASVGAITGTWYLIVRG